MATSKEYEIICERCGKVFTYYYNYNRSRKLCDECRAAARRERTHRYYESHRDERRAAARRAKSKAAKKSEDMSAVCERCECFAWKDGKCTVLMKTEPEKCSFFKTKEQFEADERKCQERATRLYKFKE